MLTYIYLFGFYGLNSNLMCICDTCILLIKKMQSHKQKPHIFWKLCIFSITKPWRFDWCFVYYCLRWQLTKRKRMKTSNMHYVTVCRIDFCGLKMNENQSVWTVDIAVIFWHLKSDWFYSFDFFLSIKYHPHKGKLTK